MDETLLREMGRVLEVSTFGITFSGLNEAAWVDHSERRGSH